MEQLKKKVDEEILSNEDFNKVIAGVESRLIYAKHHMPEEEFMEFETILTGPGTGLSFDYFREKVIVHDKSIVIGLIRDFIMSWLHTDK